MLTISIGWYWMCSRYYVQHYGRMKKKRFVTKSYAYAYFAVTGLCVLVCWFTHRSLAELGVMYLPVYTLGTALDRPNTRMRQISYLVATAVLLAACLPTLRGLPVHDFYRAHPGKFLTLIGIVWCALSVLDHFVLRDTFASFAKAGGAVQQPADFAILTVLAHCNSADALFLQKVTGLSHEDVSAHVSKLEAAGDIYVDQTVKWKQPQKEIWLATTGQSKLVEAGLLWQITR